MVVSYTERNDEKFTMTDTAGCRFTASAIDVYTGIRVSAFKNGSSVIQGWVVKVRDKIAEGVIVTK